MATLSRSLLADEAWRLSIHKYAEVLSGGRWKPYPWIVYALKRIHRTLARGNARLIVSAPPRHGKSEGVSHYLPTWYLDWFPEHRIIFTSHGESLAVKYGMKVRDNFVTNDKTWTKVHKTQQRSDDWMTSEGGGMRSTSIAGSITGLGANLIIIDDPHKNWAEANSVAVRQNIIDAFNSTIYTRLEPNGSIIVIQTRWHERDLSGYLTTEHSDNWEVIRLPAVSEGNDLIGRPEGEALCPERYPVEKLLAIKKSVGSMVFEGLYQQNPSPPEGGIIKVDWFSRWKTLPDMFDSMVQSWDLTFSDTGNSFVVGQVWGKKGADLYLVDQIRDKLNFPSTIEAMARLTNRWPDAMTKYVERAANGPALISTLNRQIPGIVPVSPRGDKSSRLAAVSGIFEAGNVWVPDYNTAPWVEDYVQEMVTFPNSANDDQVDATSQALSQLSKQQNNTDFRLCLSGSRTSPWEFANA